MVILPFSAAKLLFSRPRLFFLGLFPGLFTFAASSLLAYGFWELCLQGITVWLAIPLMMMAFLISWLLVGNISMIFVEDAIIDECQRATWGSVRLPSPGMSIRRIRREAFYSVFLTFAGVLFFLLSFIPVVGILSFVLAAWMTAYGFLASLYARKEERLDARIRLFMSDWLGNFILGAFISLMLFVPVFNVFLLGYAQILASLKFLKKEGGLPD